METQTPGISVIRSFWDHSVAVLDKFESYHQEDFWKLNTRFSVYPRDIGHWAASYCKSGYVQYQREFANIRRCKVLRETRPQAPYSVQMRQNTDQNNSEFGHFLRNEECKYPFNLLIKFMTSVRFFLYQWFCNMVTIWSGCLHCELRVISCKLSWNRNLWAVFTATSCYELRVELWNSKLQKSELNLETASYQKFLALFSKLSYLGNTS